MFGLIKNELYKVTHKLSFLVSICLLIIVAVCVPTFLDFMTDYASIEREMTTNDATVRLQSTIGEHYGGLLNHHYGEDFDNYKEEYDKYSSIFTEIIEKYKTYPGHEKDFKYQYVEDAMYLEFRIKYLDDLKENRNLEKNKYLIYFINHHTQKEQRIYNEEEEEYEYKYDFYNIYNFDEKTLDELYKESLEELEILKDIIINNNYNHIINDMLEQYKEKIEKGNNREPFYDETLSKDQLEYENQMSKEWLEIQNEIYELLQSLSKQDIRGLENDFIFYYFFMLTRDSYEPYYDNSVDVSKEFYETSEDIYVDGFFESEIKVPYKEYVRRHKSQKAMFRNEIEKFKYAINNQIDFLKRGTRDLMNNVTLYSIVIALFLIPISSSIVSKELEKGTVRSLLTKPYSRWKVLLSKVITLVIMGLIFEIVFLSVGYITSMSISGFKDAMIPTFELLGNKVIKVSFILYEVKTALLFLFGILAVCIITMMLSTLVLNSQVSGVLGVLLYALDLPLMYIFKDYTISSIFGYTILPYLYVGLIDPFGTINGETASLKLIVEELCKHTITMVPSLLMLSITTIICLTVTFILFNKRDIKN